QAAHHMTIRREGPTRKHSFEFVDDPVQLANQLRKSSLVERHAFSPIGGKLNCDRFMLLAQYVPRKIPLRKFRTPPPQIPARAARTRVPTLTQNPRHHGPDFV